jgi:hypothetical protein
MERKLVNATGEIIPVDAAVTNAPTVPTVPGPPEMDRSRVVSRLDKCMTATRFRSIFETMYTNLLPIHATREVSPETRPK